MLFCLIWRALTQLGLLAPLKKQHCPLILDSSPDLCLLWKVHYANFDGPSYQLGPKLIIIIFRNCPSSIHPLLSEMSVNSWFWQVDFLTLRQELMSVKAHKNVYRKNCCRPREKFPLNCWITINWSIYSYSIYAHMLAFVIIQKTCGQMRHSQAWPDSSKHNISSQPSGFPEREAYPSLLSLSLSLSLSISIYLYLFLFLSLLSLYFCRSVYTGPFDGTFHSRHRKRSHASKNYDQGSNFRTKRKILAAAV